MFSARQYPRDRPYYSRKGQVLRRKFVTKQVNIYSRKEAPSMIEFLTKNKLLPNVSIPKPFVSVSQNGGHVSFNSLNVYDLDESTGYYTLNQNLDVPSQGYFIIIAASSGRSLYFFVYRNTFAGNNFVPTTILVPSPATFVPLAVIYNPVSVLNFYDSSNTVVFSHAMSSFTAVSYPLTTTVPNLTIDGFRTIDFSFSPSLFDFS